MINTDIQLEIGLNEPNKSTNKDDFLLYSEFSIVTFYKYKKSGKRIKIGEASFYRCQTNISKKFSVSDSPRYSTDATIAFENVEKNLKKGDIYIDNIYIKGKQRGKGYGKYIAEWFEKETNKNIFLNIPVAETSFSGKRWESLPAFYDKSFSNMELKKSVANSLLFTMKKYPSNI